MNAVVQTKPKLPGFVNFLLVIALGILAAKLMWMILSPAKKLDYRIEETGVVSGAQRKVVNYGKLIADQHLFGEIKKVAVVKAPPKATTETTAPPPPKLNLKLHGIVAYEKRSGFALISSKGGPQKVYGEDEEIEKGVKVTKILSGKVIIDNNGKPEDLILPVKKIKDKTASANNGKPVQQQNQQAHMPNPDMLPPQGGSAKSKVDLSAFRQKVMANPRRLMDIATPSPAIVDGQFIGFRVQPGSKRKLFRQLGFRPNDIILEVNGIVLDDASKGAMVLGELAQASDLSVRVKRGSQELYIQHSF